MLLRNRVPGIETLPGASGPKAPYEHLEGSAISVLRWLNASRVDYVLVGPVARAARGDTAASGPVSIVPAPYGRNLDRLARALNAARAKLRLDGAPATDDAGPARITAEKLVRPERWALRCGEHELDVEGRPVGVPRYQELLYEAARTALAEELLVEVASPEDIEHYDHVRRTGSSPRITVTRAVREPEQS